MFADFFCCGGGLTYPILMSSCFGVSKETHTNKQTSKWFSMTIISKGCKICFVLIIILKCGEIS